MLLKKGTGFHIRDDNVQDVEGDVDIDGDDEDAFGDVQFTERDLVSSTLEQQPVTGPSGYSTLDSELDAEDDENALRALVAEGKIVRRRTPSADIAGMKLKTEEIMDVGEAEQVDDAVSAARQSGSKAALTHALEEKVKLLVGLVG